MGEWVQGECATALVELRVAYVLSRRQLALLA